jgi:hypothetical protein
MPRIDWKAAETATFTPAQARVRGWVLAGVGVVLILMMGALILWFASVILNDGPQAKEHFTGGPVVAVFIFGLFAFVFSFGVAALKAGIFQIRHGKRDLSALVWGKAMMIVLSAAGLITGILDALMD